MTTTHTPKPWEIISRLGASVIYAAADGQVVAEVIGADCLPEAQANARLLAAAPDLLAALRGLTDSPIVVESSDQGELYRLLQRARAALAKAIPPPPDDESRTKKLQTGDALIQERRASKGER